MFSWLSGYLPFIGSTTYWCRTSLNSSLSEDIRYSCTRNPVVSTGKRYSYESRMWNANRLGSFEIPWCARAVALYQPISIVIVFHAICLVVGLFLFLTVSHSKKKRPERERT
ncbi:ATP-binding cassette sub-family G member 8 [Trichonephila clavata]|uniref:ATP-binding cassette sub-family G member 8 n=1 Tax=Trichonephila clavata TaxID=2740835 RepID=A0A8X6EWA0_TRICU|nr:ATP-binding cassette sub-family G member 8 [Trichonephila clavata]